MTPIIRGQRWMSEAEPELGLGVVVDVDDRSVALEFSAADVTRRYALKSAPLRRVRFAVGDTVLADDGVRLEVDAVDEVDGLLLYRSAGRPLREDRISARMALGGPRERLLSGKADPSSLFDLRLETIGHLHAARRSPVRGFLGPRLELLPHQFYIAAEATARHAPRVLLADETGLGKTIEACLTVNRLLLSGRAARVLILVPDSLVHQWLVELRRRFNLSFAVFDEERCAAIVGSSSEDDALGADMDDAGAGIDDDESDDGENPFESEQLVLAGIGLLAASEERARQAADAGWELVIVDEAHHLRWSSAGASPEYRAVEAVARGSSGLLLLTATPEQLGEESHFARLRLLDPDRYSDLLTWQREAEHYRETARIAECLLEGDAVAGRQPPDLDADQARALAAVLELDEAEVRDRAAAPDGRRRLLDDLIDRHGPGRVMFRNTRAVVSGFPQRRVELRALDAVAIGEHLDEPVATARPSYW
ncbi:MAG: hypothetical protein E4H03_06435 [Myxococcales bacterium]|nr:MAG: hypothetical protein E4H03_06435 [Myxococcales bacterium]